MNAHAKIDATLPIYACPEASFFVGVVLSGALSLHMVSESATYEKRTNNIRMPMSFPWK